MSTKDDSDVAVKNKVKLREPSQYDVIVHNNDLTSYDEVILILSQSFSITHNEALAIARKVDTEDKGVCGTYSREIAEAKLLVVEMVKGQLIQIFPHRHHEITLLRFTVEKS